jgi:pyruvate dehydrogenase E2 component (dihydrolipoamide acetyltransferase)
VVSDTTTSALAAELGQFGAVEAAPLSRIQALTARAMQRAWTTIPHVTHQDRLDVTELEAARKAGNASLPAEERLSPLPFLMKAVAAALVAHPRLNAAFDEEAGQLLVRQYVNVGFAIDAPKGLLVAVVPDCDKRSVEEIAADIRRLTEKARGRGLALDEMTGAGFTVSSLGGLGGTGFTPIVNAPQVAILGVSRLEEVPVRGAGDAIAWRQMLPVALSYDHRALNGADAGRFLATLQQELRAPAA